jgi:hypothetical protein
MRVIALLLAAAFAQQPPQALPPFPQPGTRTAKPAQPPPAQPPPAKPSQPPTAQPAPPPTTAGAKPAPAKAPVEEGPTEAVLGVPIYPGAQFLKSYDAGRGQRFYLYGTTASFVDLVSYYRERLKQRGELVFETPATHEFLVGRFREDTMAFPPGVTIKDFQSEVSQGYPNPRVGAQPARFPTVIQIVAVTEK